MNYFNRIASLRNQAEGKFRNWDGHVNSRRYHHAEGGNVVAAPVETLDPNDRTWTVTVTNGSSANAATAYVFGSALDLTDTLNTAAGVTVTVAESTHLQVKTGLLFQPVRIVGLKMTVVSATQFSNVITLYDTQSTGGGTFVIWQPLNWRSAQNQLTTQIDAPSFELLLTPTMYMKFTINKAEVVTFTFTIAQKVILGNTLRGTPVVAQSNIPAPTGLVQVDRPRGL